MSPKRSIGRLQGASFLSLLKISTGLRETGDFHEPTVRLRSWWRRDLIRRMSRANPLWGAPRIHGELLKLGIKISQATVGRWMPWRPKVPSPTWRSFLRNHLPDIAAIDMFVVATATFQLLYALIVLSLDRRRVVHFAVTPNPTQDWLSRQMTEAFPWDTAPRYLLRDRDKSYGPAFRHRVRAMGITEVITAPRSPWQNPYAERLIGSIRRECLDHVIIFNERHLRRVLSSYFQYHHDTRTHLSLGKDCPRPRPIQSPSAGNIIAFPEDESGFVPCPCVCHLPVRFF